MKKTLLTTAMLGIVAFAPNAMAADPVVEAVNDWTGFYIGANGGYVWGDTNVDDPTEDDSNDGTIDFFYDSFDFDVDGGILGGQIGYNWQSGSMVYGLELDAQGLWADGDTTFSAAIFNSPVGPFDTVVSSDLDFLATLRARVGYDSGRALWYITGGGAIGSAESELDFPFIGGAPSGFNDKDSNTHLGLTVGAGVEVMVTESLSAKLEYMYVHLFDESYDFLIAGDAYNWDQDFDLNIVRAGINWHF